MGMFSAFIGLVKHPYVGTRVEGPLGLVKGVGRGLGGFPYHILGGKLHASFYLIFNASANKWCSGLGYTWLFTQRHRV